MKTKDEILTEFGCPVIPFDENVTMYYPAILSAMDEYAEAKAREAFEAAREVTSYCDIWNCKGNEKKYHDYETFKQKT